MHDYTAGGEISPSCTRADDAFTTISELCTMLVISEENSALPLGSICGTIRRTLKMSPHSGDVYVMVARCVGHILDRFSTILRFHRAPVSVLGKCLRSLFALVDASFATVMDTLTFDQTVRRELMEELLNCLTLCYQSTVSFSDDMPSVARQLDFCESVMADVSSNRVSVQALRHCIVLARMGALSVDAAHRRRMETMLRQELLRLREQDVNFEWDERLRVVTEGWVTMYVWCRRCCVDAAAGELVHVSPTPTTTCHARQDVEAAHAARDRPCAVRATDLCEMDDMVCDICAHICASSTAETRKELTLACTTAILCRGGCSLHTSVSGSSFAPSAAARQRLLSVLVHVLQRSDRSTALKPFANPFHHKPRCASNEDEEEDTMKSYTTLQWVLPSVTWSALVLVATLCGAHVPMEHDYLWTWRGEDGIFYRYNRADRKRLTEAFMQARAEVSIGEGKHVVNMVTLTDRRVRAALTSIRVQFQPIPCVSYFSGAILYSVDARGGVAPHGPRTAEVDSDGEGTTRRPAQSCGAYCAACRLAAPPLPAWQRWFTSLSSVRANRLPAKRAVRLFVTWWRSSRRGRWGCWRSD